ncbi:MAG TPA: hypothetical protein DCF63_12670 [Planctomycetaceae bacterium]|nr:hypothetical protein [Planctomycetaceae bacterium]
MIDSTQTRWHIVLLDRKNEIANLRHLRFDYLPVIRLSQAFICSVSARKGMIASANSLDASIDP